MNIDGNLLRNTSNNVLPLFQLFIPLDTVLLCVSHKHPPTHPTDPGFSCIPPELNLPPPSPYMHCSANTPVFVCWWKYNICFVNYQEHFASEFADCELFWFLVLLVQREWIDSVCLVYWIFYMCHWRLCRTKPHSLCCECVVIQLESKQVKQMSLFRSPFYCKCSFIIYG